MKNLVYLILFHCVFNSDFPLQVESINAVQISPQTRLEYFKSLRYIYSIAIPPGFKIVSATGKNIDLKMINKTGNSILVNITARLPEEYRITAHNYTVEFLEKNIQPTIPNFRITDSKKIYVDGEKAFLIRYSCDDVKAIECYIFFNNLAFVLTATAKVNDFNEFENTYLSTITSLKF